MFFWQVFLQGEFVVEAFYFLSTSTAKISILLYYLRIFTGRNFKITTWSLITVCVLHGVIIAIVTLFGCRPISAAWDLSIVGPTCIDRRALYFAKTAMSIFFDFATFLLPLWVSSKNKSIFEDFFAESLLIFFIIVRSCSSFNSLGNKR